MQIPSPVSGFTRILAVLLLVAGSVALTGSNKTPYSPREKAYWADRALVDFVNPGLNITINSAAISSNGTITVTYTLTDSTGLPLDASGTTTPGAITLAYVAAYIPSGQQQYTALTTASATGAALGTITRPDFELPAFGSGKPPTQVGPGQYTYTFTATAPQGFSTTTTYTVAIDGNRDLTAFNLGTNYAGITYNFVPNGSKVTVTRDVIRTQSCNRCHDQLAFHGGYAHAMEMCVLCHQPQNADPVSGNSLDLKVMAHQIHMGSSLPSVLGYTAGTQKIPPTQYIIYGYMNSANNFSTVVDPANVQRCEVCHDQTTGAAQANAFMTQPTRAACGSCHNNVNFATGVNHPANIPLSDDSECANCHVPQGEQPFDASVLGAHVVASDTAALYPPNPDTLISGIDVKITNVTNCLAGQNPQVAFTLLNDAGNAIPISSVSFIQLTMAGPTTDYGYTNFGSGTSSTPGYVTESAATATCNSAGNCTYNFTHAVPAGQTGTFAMALEARYSETILSGTVSQQSVTEGAQNSVYYFSVDGSTVAPRRTVVALSNCNQCHVALSLHGGLRNQVEYCVMCHNPSNTDASQRANATVASDKSAPPQGINFNLLVHRIHDGVNVVPAGGKPFIVVGYMGSHNDFSGVLYPAMSPEGEATYLQNCQMCHTTVNNVNTETILPIGLNAVTDPEGWYTPAQATGSACSGCHVSKAEAAHFVDNTDPVLGEACSVCHASGAQFAVDAMHVQ